MGGEPERCPAAFHGGSMKNTFVSHIMLPHLPGQRWTLQIYLLFLYMCNSSTIERPVDLIIKNINSITGDDL